MELNEAIYTRRSYRKYKPDAVPKELLAEIAKAGTYAASGMGRQAGKIVVVTNKELRDQLMRMNREIMGQTEGDPFYGAPAVIVVLADKNVGTHVYDGALVMGNMMLEAHALGLGCCWIHRAKEEFESEEGKEILKKLGIEGEYEGIGHLIVGYPDGNTPVARERKADFVTFAE